MNEQDARITHVTAQTVVEELKALIAKAIERELRIDVRGVEILHTKDDQNEEIVKVTVTLEVTRKKLRRGAYFDLVSTAARTLRDNGETAIPYIVAKMNEGVRPRAH